MKMNSNKILFLFFSIILKVAISSFKKSKDIEIDENITKMYIDNEYINNEVLKFKKDLEMRDNGININIVNLKDILTIKRNYDNNESSTHKYEIDDIIELEKLTYNSQYKNYYLNDLFYVDISNGRISFTKKVLLIAGEHPRELISVDFLLNFFTSIKDNTELL